MLQCWGGKDHHTSLLVNNGCGTYPTMFKCKNVIVPQCCLVTGRDIYVWVHTSSINQPSGMATFLLLSIQVYISINIDQHSGWFGLNHWGMGPHHYQWGVVTFLHLSIEAWVPTTAINQHWCMMTFLTYWGITQPPLLSIIEVWANIELWVTLRHGQALSHPVTLRHGGL